MVTFILGIATDGSKHVGHHVSHAAFAFAETYSYSKLTCNKCHDACSKVLMALACLYSVTQAAQQITDVAHVECGNCFGFRSLCTNR